MIGEPGSAGESAEQTDAQIIAASFDNAAVFADLFDRHFKSVHRYLARRVGVDLAEDLAAETFLIAFDRRHAYQMTSPRSLPWLLGIATNLARQQWRTEKRALKALATTGLDPVMEDHSEWVVAKVVAKAECRAVASCLAKMSRGDRDVLLLVAWEGLTYDEVAAALGVPTGTVRSRLHRARGQVKSALAAAAVDRLAGGGFHE